jgi:ABC-type polysaccharide/polyol phosphate transport system ATPase subunit
MPRIDVRNASVTFTARQRRTVSLKEYLLRGMFRGSVNPKVAVHALSDVTLSAADGDRVGVIGHNGAGKTTLLKLLAGIYPPTAGSCEVEGRICSLFDIALGFENDATGWENITYRSYLQGDTPAGVRRKRDAIGEFTELGQFLDLPVRNYSAGMRMRLAFSIATAAEPEVLLIDEVLAVGDAAFQIKARARMKELITASRLMVVVSHDVYTVVETCNRVVWMRHGRVVMDGPAQQVVDAYLHEATGAAPARAA